MIITLFIRRNFPYPVANSAELTVQIAKHVLVFSISPLQEPELKIMLPEYFWAGVLFILVGSGSLYLLRFQRYRKMLFVDTPSGMSRMKIQSVTLIIGGLAFCFGLFPISK